MRRSRSAISGQIWDPQTAELMKSDAGGKIADLINRLAGPLADEFGMMLGDTVRVYRVKNWIRTVQKTQRILQDAGIPPNAVPPRLLLPITEACSVEDNESLQEMWAGLLATASQKADSVSPSFVETLKQLTPDEARRLDSLYESQKKTQRWLEEYRPLDFGLLRTRREMPEPAMLDTYERLGLIGREYNVSLVGVGRLRHSNSVDAALRAIGDIDTQVDYDFVFTKFAVSFLEACRGPRPKSTVNGK